MKSRLRRKYLKRRATSPDFHNRLEAKLDLLLEHSKHQERRAVILGAVSGGITGGAVALVVAYARAVLLGAR